MTRDDMSVTCRSWWRRRLAAQPLLRADAWFTISEQSLVEAAGIEPASGKAATTVTTCVVRGEISSLCPPRTECDRDQPGSISRLGPRRCFGAQLPGYDAHTPALETQPEGTGT